MPLQWAADIEPLLRTTYRLLDESPDHVVRLDALAAELGGGASGGSLRRTFAILEAAGWIELQDGDGTRNDAGEVAPTTQGLQGFMGWPAPGRAA